MFCLGKDGQGLQYGGTDQCTAIISKPNRILQYNLEIRFSNLEDDVFLLVLLDPIQLVFPRRFLASKVRLHQITRRAAKL